MAEVELRVGAKLDLLSPKEFRAGLSDELGWLREQVLGVRWRRLPRISGAAVSGALNIGGASSPTQAGPLEGYAWSLRRITVGGLTSGATPDIVNLFFGGVGAGQPPAWQFNGNNFAYTFGKLELTMLPGETLSFVSQGTFTATGTITVAGELVELPAEQLGRLAI